MNSTKTKKNNENIHIIIKRSKIRTGIEGENL